MSFPSYDVYRHLYRRFITGGMQPHEFVVRAGNLEGKVALDLCAGGGDITTLLVEKGASVVAVDMHEEMLSKDLRFRRPPTRPSAGRA